MPEFGERRFERPCEVRLAGRVGLDRERPPPQPADGRRARFGVLQVEIDNDQVRPCLGESGRHRARQYSAAANHNRYLAVQ